MHNSIQCRAAFALRFAVVQVANFRRISEQKLSRRGVFWEMSELRTGASNIDPGCNHSDVDSFARFYYLPLLSTSPLIVQLMQTVTFHV